MMIYTKRPTSRIQDPHQINYVKSILEASAQQCQQEGMYAPEIYLATAQRIADTYSLKDSNNPRITFNAKEQMVKGQDNPVTELTATIGDRTSTSYFLIKDSLPQGTKASPEQLIQLRPDIVSTRIAVNLGVIQPTPVISPVMAGVIPTLNIPSMSKVQVIAQTMTPEPPPPPLNSVVAGFTALTQAPETANKANPNNSIFTAPEANKIAPMAQSNQIFNANLTAPPILQAEPIHNPEMAEALNSQNLQTAGNFTQSIGKVLKDMAKGEINPIQLYGDTLNIIGSFINGIPNGIQEARLNSIAQQMKLIEKKRTAIDLKMDRVGDDFIASESKPAISSTDVFKTSVSNPESRVKTSPALPATSQSTSKTADTAIDKLLQSNASLDDKLDAIEQTLDKMLEELIKIEKNLEAIQASLVSNAPIPVPNPEDMVIETEAKTEVELVANAFRAEVPVRTEIETEVVAEAKTETAAAEEIEVPEITVDLTPDLDRQMADLISSYDGDLDQLNDRLQAHKIQINLSEDRQLVSVSEIDNGISFLVFEAQAGEEDWKVASRINSSTKLDILECFVEAEGAVLANVTTQLEQATEPEKVKKEEPSLFL
jgi:hypothetical protein